MNAPTFGDCLRDALRDHGLLAWAENRPLREIMAKPEILQAVEAAWAKYTARAPKEGNPQ